MRKKANSLTNQNRYPQFIRPRFRHAMVSAYSVLRSLGNPDAPISFEKYLSDRNWMIIEDDLHGPDGYMMKIVSDEKTNFAVFVATDYDLDGPYDPKTFDKRKQFTIAHELGHILLHGQFTLNTYNSLEVIPSDVAGIMEVEAHWFASHLLMPDYIFTDILDLVPDQLADKCGVNITAAQKRLKNLSPLIHQKLKASARLDKKSIHCTDPGTPPEKWNSIDEALSSSRLKYICKCCGLFHNERNIWGRSCSECGNELLRIELAI